MRTAKEVLELNEYANRLISSYKNYNELIKNPSVDKKKKEISAKIVFQCYTGNYGSSSVFDKMPQPNDALNKAISQYLTDNFDEAMEYCAKYIKNSIKGDIKSLISKKEELEKIISELS